MPQPEIILTVEERDDFVAYLEHTDYANIYETLGGVVRFLASLDSDSLDFEINAGWTAVVSDAIASGFLSAEVSRSGAGWTSTPLGPNCKRPNVLTAAEARKVYQCNRCARAEESGF